MALDGIVTRALSNELNLMLNGGKIDKIYQPEKDEMILHIRNNGENYKLLISSSSNNPRVHITHITKPNPEVPPMFCMLLRKHLQGGKIVNITQPSLERILIIDIQNMDELGVLTIKQLIIEIMGRHSNLILIDKESKKIIDSIKRITNEISTVRQILPGIKYEFPPNQNKLNPLEVEDDMFISNLDFQNKGVAVFKHLYTQYVGLSPLVAREICYKANLDSNIMIGELNEINKKELFSAFKETMNKVKRNEFKPNIIFKNSAILDFSAININQYEDLEKKIYSSINDILEEFYYTRDIQDRIKQKSTDLKKIISLKLERSLNKLSKQKQELLDAEKREKYRIYGDLIMANLYRIDKGDKVELENFYNENMEKVVIKLDPRLTPSQNAQLYYKKYNKLKSAYEFVKEQIEKTKEEIDYLENVMISIENSTTVNEIDEIREELIKEGYLKGSSNIKKKKNEQTSKPRHFISSDGFHIYVGKNNKQNDYLTLKFASKNDIWLHTKEIAGSHVIIKTDGEEVPERTLYEAAILAAYFSKGNMSSNVPVDYAIRKNVRKPNGAKPGMVIYDNNSTIYVTPTEEEVKKIKEMDS